MSITTLIILVTVVVSGAALLRPELLQRLLFNPYQVDARGQWYRFITHAFVHSDWIHLLVNMWVLWNFGPSTEMFFTAFAGAAGPFLYLALYVGGVMFASLPAYGRHRTNPGYNAVGASGAVAAILFSAIYFTPTVGIGIMFIPVPIPAFIFGVIYLGLEYYLDKKSNDHIAHDAHFWGAVFGFVFTALVALSHFPTFVAEIRFYLGLI